MHPGLALLKLLLEADREPRSERVHPAPAETHQSERETEIVWPLNVTVADDTALERLYRTVMNLLNHDDGRIADEAMAIGFPEFEYIELVSHACI